MLSMLLEGHLVRVLRVIEDLLPNSQPCFTSIVTHFSELCALLTPSSAYFSSIHTLLLAFDHPCCVNQMTDLHCFS